MTAKVRIGDVMRECGISRAKANYYTALGLVKTTGRTDAGFGLYDIEDTRRRIGIIKDLQGKRYRLKEIREKMDNELVKR